MKDQLQPRRTVPGLFINRLALVFGLVALLLNGLRTEAATVYSQAPKGDGSLYQSSVNGTDYDQLTWDKFRLTNSVAITEVRWRGGYIYGGMYSGHVTNWTIAIYRDVGGFQPDVINPPFAVYNIAGNAGETAAGTFSGMPMYDYSVTLPSPFQAVANANYWLLIVANEPSIPDWGIALSSGGNSNCFRRVAGMADWWFYYASWDTAFTLLTTDGPTVAIAATASPANAGEIIGAGNYPSGSVATLAVVPTAGNGFVNWTENGNEVSASATYRFTVSSSRTLVANFLPLYTVTASASPGYGGSVTGGGTYNSNATVMVSAAPATGYAFVNWTEFGTEVSTSPDYSFNADGNHTLVANFTTAGASATFDFDTGTPAVYPHQGMPATQMNNGVTATFTTLSGGWSVQNDFYYWVPRVFSGNFLYPSTWGSTMAIEFSEPVTNFSMAFFTGDVSSEFDVPTTIRVSAYTNSTMANPVAVVTAKGDWVSGAYPEGTMSLNSATPFVKVKIDMPSGQNPPVSYLYWVDNIVVQHVTPPPVSIAAQASPLDGGVISGDGAFASGSAVFLTATPNAGYQFVSWTENGGLVCDTVDYAFNATTNRTLIANFSPLPVTYAIVTTAQPSNGGMTYGDGMYTNGELALLTAVADPAFEFVNWTENGTVLTNSTNYSFTVTSNRLFEANFAPLPQLKLVMLTNSLVISWPTNAVGFNLEVATHLNPANWQSTGLEIKVVGDQYQAVAPAPTWNCFFRLKRP